LGAVDGGTVTVYTGAMTVAATGAVLASSGPRSDGGAVAVYATGDLALSGRAAASGGQGVLTQRGGTVTLGVGGNLTTAATTVIDGYGQEQGGALVAQVAGDVVLAGAITLEGGAGALQKVGGTVEVLSGGDVLVSGTVDVSAQENWVWESGVRTPTGATVQVRGANVTVTGTVRANGGSGAGIQVGGRVTVTATGSLGLQGSISATAQESLPGFGSVHLEYCELQPIDGIILPTPIFVGGRCINSCEPPCSAPSISDHCLDEDWRIWGFVPPCLNGVCARYSFGIARCEHGCLDGVCLCDPVTQPCCDATGHPKSASSTCIDPYYEYRCDVEPGAETCGAGILVQHIGSYCTGHSADCPPARVLSEDRSLSCPADAFCAANDLGGIDCTPCASFGCHSGRCLECLAAIDCAPTGDPCLAAACTGGVCVPEPLDFEVPVSGDECRREVCQGGAHSFPAVTRGTACGPGGTGLCDGAGSCEQCLPDYCPGVDTQCQSRACDAAGQCAWSNADAWAPCTSGGAMCDGEGHCVECLEAADCSGSELECKLCTDFECVYAGTETELSQQSPGNCRREVCDGAGGSTDEIDDSDVPSDGNPCTDGVCTSGAGSQVASADGRPCGAGLVCDGYGACVACDPGYHPCCLGDGTIAPRVTEATLAASTPCDSYELDDATYLCRTETAGGDPVEGEKVCGGTVWAYRHQAYCDGASGTCTGSLTYWKGEAYTDACLANQLCAVDGTYSECQWCEVKVACEDEYAATYSPATDPCPTGAAACAYDRTAVFCGPNNCDESWGGCIDPCDESSNCMSGYECQGAEIALASRACVLGVCQETRHFLGTCPGGCDLGECQPLACESDTCETYFECSLDGSKILMNRGECWGDSCVNVPVVAGTCLDACDPVDVTCDLACDPAEPCCSSTGELPGSGATCQTGAYEYRCDGGLGGVCGGMARRRPEVRQCLDDRASCTGPVLDTGPWEDVADCSGQLCFADATSARCVACETSCAGGQCQDCDSGVCCDLETGAIRPPVNDPSQAEPCSDAIYSVETECVGNCAGEIRRREQRWFCGGTTACDSLQYTPWRVIQTCGVDSVCVEAEGDARCESCTGTGVPDQRPYCDVDGSRVIYPEAATGYCDLDQDRCVYPDCDTWSCGTLGCTGAWCNPDPALTCDGQGGVDGDPCDDGDPCTDGDHCAGELCLGQAKRCDAVPCPETDCGFY
jgi:hypothetical protein